MDEAAPSKQAAVITRILAGLTAIFGAYIIISLRPLLKNFPTLDEPGDFLFLFVFPIPVFVFGCYCIFAGYRLWHQISPKNIRRISFSLSIVLFFLFVTLIGYYRPHNSTSPNYRSISQFDAPLLMISAGLFYLLFNKLLLRWLGMPSTIDWAQREKSAKRYFGWFAFFLYTAAINLIQTFLTEKYKTIHSFVEFLLLALGFIIVPIVLAFMIYKLGVAIAMHNKPKDASAQNNDADSAANGAAETS